MAHGSLLTKTIALLRDRTQPLPEIAKATGLPFYWLQALSSDVTGNPGVNRVQALYEYLSGRKLEV